MSDGPMTRPTETWVGTTRTVRVPGPDGPEAVTVVVNRAPAPAGAAPGPVREVFVRDGAPAEANAIGRLVSRALQAGDDLGELAATLRGIGGPHAPVPWPGGVLVRSLPDALGRLLEAEARRGECARCAGTAVGPDGKACGHCYERGRGR